jgi:hypothetical protein
MSRCVRLEVRVVLEPCFPASKACFASERCDSGVVVITTTSTASSLKSSSVDR